MKIETFQSDTIASLKRIQPYELMKCNGENLLRFK